MKLVLFHTITAYPRLRIERISYHVTHLPCHKTTHTSREQINGCHIPFHRTSHTPITHTTNACISFSGLPFKKIIGFIMNWVCICSAQACVPGIQLSPPHIPFACVRNAGTARCQNENRRCLIAF